MATRQHVSSCSVAGHRFGIEVERVQEVINATAITRVPLAPREIAGLLNLSGQIVTAFDVRRCLDLHDRETDAQRVMVVVRTGDGCFSLLVDDVGDVLEVIAEDFVPPPETLRGRSRELLRGAYKTSGGLLLALDVDRLVTMCGGM